MMVKYKIQYTYIIKVKKKKGEGRGAYTIEFPPSDINILRCSKCNPRRYNIITVCLIMRILHTYI